MCKHKSGGMSKPTASQGALAEATPSGANCPQSEPRSSSDSEDSDAEQAPMLPQLQNPLQTPASYVPRQPHISLPHGYAAARWVPRPETEDAEHSPMGRKLQTPNIPLPHGYAARWVPRPETADSGAEHSPMLHPGRDAAPCQLQPPNIPLPHGYAARWIPCPETADSEAEHSPMLLHPDCQLQTNVTSNTALPRGYAARWAPRPETAESDAEHSPMLHPDCQLQTPLPHCYAARWVPRPETADSEAVLHYGEASCHTSLPHGSWVPHQTGNGDSPYADKVLNPNHVYQALHSSVTQSSTPKPQDGSCSYYCGAARFDPRLDHAHDNKTPDQSPMQPPDSTPDPDVREPASPSVANGGDSSPSCKICHAAARDGDPLISPCRCSGTMRYIHCSCLMTWLEVCYKRGRRPMSCELCQYQYHWHKKFQVRHLRLPHCSRRDKALHLLFLVSVVLMVSCASVTALCFRSETRLHAKEHAKEEQQRPLSAAELATVASGVLFFVAFFAAMLAEIRARDTLCRLLARFVRLNQQWYIDEYRKPVPV